MLLQENMKDKWFYLFNKLSIIGKKIRNCRSSIFGCHHFANTVIDRLII